MGNKEIKIETQFQKDFKEYLKSKIIQTEDKKYIKFFSKKVVKFLNPIFFITLIYNFKINFSYLSLFYVLYQFALNTESFTEITNFIIKVDDTIYDTLKSIAITILIK